ncbi:hypothetical protein GHC57_12885 [Roseospira navarrensis]|uniref:Sulfotransferase n=1 Tax=Roseospira navarrensis TaxID=140058 RepID=A0A7X1ZG66_9PROT|nr:hypothetical protein [Roseospira navarrensis]
MAKAAPCRLSTPLSIRSRIGMNLKSYLFKLSQPMRKQVADLQAPVFISGNGESGTHVVLDVFALSGAFSYTGTYGDRKKGLFDPTYGSKPSTGSLKPIEGILHYWSGVGLPWERPGEWEMHAPLTLKDCGKLDTEEVRRRYARAGAALPWARSHQPKPPLDKMPTYVLMTEIIDRVFPEARHVIVVRDPRAVWRSILRRWRDPSYDPHFQGYPSGFYGNVFLPGHEKVLEESDEIRIAFTTTRILELALEVKKKAPDRVFLICFEELCANPRSILKKIENRFSFSYADEIVNKAYPFASGAINIS